MGNSLAFPTFDKLIANFEGFGTPQASTINLANNPGAIIPGQFATAHGATGTLYTAQGQPVAAFPTVQQGTSAEDALVQYYANQGASISDLINAWSPSNAPGNNPAGTQNYINTISKQIGATPQTGVIQAEQAYDSGNNVTNTLGAPGTTTTAPSAGTAPGTSQSTPGGILGQIWSGDPLGLNKIGPKAPTAPDLSAGRIAAFVLGLILIAVGLWMFKPVQQAVSAGRRAGELLAA